MSFAPRVLRQLAVAAAVIAAPSAAAARQSTCLPDTATGTVVLEGIVVDEDTSFPLQGAGVSARWIDGKGRAVERSTNTDGAGEFRFCGVPAPTAIDVQATWFGERSAQRSLTTGPDSVRVVLEVVSPHLVVAGHVREAPSGQPLAAAAVRVGQGPEQLSGADGAFRFEKIPPGLHEVTIERIGFATVRDSVEIEFGTSVDLDIRLAAQAVPLEPIRVVVRSLVLERTGFYRREGRGLGTFITRQDIEARSPVTSSNLLRRVPGLRLARGRFNEQIAMGRGNCPYRFIIDGARINAGFSIDEMPPNWFEGLEVYQGPSQVPTEFSAGPLEPNASCGLIVIWTRNRR